MKYNPFKPEHAGNEGHYERGYIDGQKGSYYNAPTMSQFIHLHDCLAARMAYHDGFDDAREDKGIPR